MSSDQQPNNPMHGIKLKDVLEYLIAELGWEGLAREVDIRCFKYDPSLKSSLVFLRKTPWARAEVEALYLETKKIGRTVKPPKPNSKYNSRG